MERLKPFDTGSDAKLSANRKTASTGSDAQSSTPRIFQRTPQRRIPIRAAIAEIEADKQHNDGEADPFPHVMKDVMAHLVAEHGENLGRIHACDGGVPHHHAL